MEIGLSDSEADQRNESPRGICSELVNLALGEAAAAAAAAETAAANFADLTVFSAEDAQRV